MTVELALLISSDGIALAHRQAAGHWAMLRDVSFSAPDLDKAMKSLRKEAEERAGPDFSCLLILPDDQILYTSLTAPTDDPEMTSFRIEEGLEGMTPYAVSELVYDWRSFDSDRVKLAVVARETLDEARGFVENHGFKPAGFAAMPPQERFPGVPLFELSKDAEGVAFSDDGIAFGPDTFGQEPEETEDPLENVPPKNDAQAQPEVSEAPDAVTDAATAELDGDHDPKDVSTEATNGADAEENGTQPAAEPQPADLASALWPDGAVDGALPPEPDPQPAPPQQDDPKDQAFADAADRDPEEVIAGIAPPAEVEPTPDPEPEPFAALTNGTPPLTDPSLMEPVAPLNEADRDGGGARLSDAIQASRNASAAMEDSASPEFSARGSRVPARDIEDTSAPAEPALDTPNEPDLPAPKGQNPLAERLSRVREASKSRTAKNTKPGPLKGAAAKAVRAKPAGATPIKATAKGGAASGADGRKSRLSSLTAAPFPGPAANASPESGTSSLTGRLTGLIGRGRKEDPATSIPPTGGTTGGTSGGPRVVASAGRLTALGAALQAQPNEPETKELTSGSVALRADEDSNLTGGVLGRKSSEASENTTFRTGLILTVVLLVLLAAIAVWSALFLPNSPVARLFGSGGDQLASEDPLDAPAAPEAITAPPAIGELATVDAPPAALLDDGVVDEAALDAAPEDEAAADGIDLAAADTSLPDQGVDEASGSANALDETLSGALDETIASTRALDPTPEPVAIPPLAPLPLDGIPSLEETEAVYAEYNIWQRPPDRPDLAPLDSLSDLSLSAQDSTVTAFDAISLPSPVLDPGETLRRVPAPPPFGTQPETTSAGLVAPTPEGVMTPDGVRVTAGPPPVQAVPRPREEALPPRTPTFDIEDAILGTFRPAQRPGDLGEVAPEPAPGTPAITRASLSPQPRTLPTRETGSSAATQAAAASLVPQTTAPISETAVVRSLVPAARPSDIDDIVASAIRPAREAPAPVVEASAIAPGPSIPSNADVARAATQSNEIRLRQVNLIGVSGTNSDRQAIVRLPSGRFVRVEVGDRLDGGRVAAIGASTLQYVRNGRTVTLDIPG